MITEASLTHDLIASQVHAVAQAAYALEAKLIGCADFPPLRESPEDLQQSPDRFLIYQDECGPVIGVLSFKEHHEGGVASLTITRLVVSPAHQRRGIATALHYDLARRLPRLPLWKVSTAEANKPACSLYQTLGYALTGVSLTPEGIRLVHFTRSQDHLTATVPSSA